MDEKELEKVTITITKEQREWVIKNNINLSSLTRRLLKEHINMFDKAINKLNNQSSSAH